MSSYQSKALLQQLKAEVSRILETVRPLLTADDAMMNRQPLPGSWSPAQVIDHLNYYNKVYLANIREKLDGARHKGIGAKASFTPGWLGNYFTKMMQPKPDGTVASKMKAPKDSRPSPQLDSRQVVQTFISGQQQLLALMQEAAQTDLGKVRVPTSLSSLLTLKLGDTFRFLVAHQQRHTAQLKRALQTLPQIVHRAA